MSTAYLNLTGIARWIKHIEPDSMYDNWQMDFKPDEKSLKKIEDSGLQVTPKEDEEGLWYKFRRPTQKVIKKELVNFDPPKVTNPDGQPISYKIANGAEVEALVIVYDTVKGKGHRWESLKVLKHEPFEGVAEEKGNEPLPKTSGRKPKPSSDNQIPF